MSHELEKHTLNDERQFGEINQKLATMKDNHLYHIEKSVAAIEVGLTSLHTKLDENSKETTDNKANIGWMKWIIMAVGGAIIIQTVALIFK